MSSRHLVCQAGNWLGSQAPGLIGRQPVCQAGNQFGSQAPGLLGRQPVCQVGNWFGSQAPGLSNRHLVCQAGIRYVRQATLFGNFGHERGLKSFSNIYQKLFSVKNPWGKVDSDFKYLQKCRRYEFFPKNRLLNPNHNRPKSVQPTAVGKGKFFFQIY